MHCEHGVFKQRLNTGSLPTCESLLCECDFVPPTQLDCLLGTLHSVRGEPAESLTDTATLVMREAASLWLAENTIMLHPETMLPPNKLAILRLARTNIRGQSMGFLLQNNSLELECLTLARHTSCQCTRNVSSHHHSSHTRPPCRVVAVAPPCAASGALHVRHSSLL